MQGTKATAVMEMPESDDDLAKVCSWCNRMMRDAKAGQVVSHGCCRKCSEKVQRQFNKEPKR